MDQKLVNCWVLWVFWGNQWPLEFSPYIWIFGRVDGSLIPPKVSFLASIQSRVCTTPTNYQKILSLTFGTYLWYYLQWPTQAEHWRYPNNNQAVRSQSSYISSIRNSSYPAILWSNFHTFCNSILILNCTSTHFTFYIIHFCPCCESTKTEIKGKEQTLTNIQKHI